MGLGYDEYGRNIFVQIIYYDSNRENFDLLKTFELHVLKEKYQQIGGIMCSI